MNAKGISSLNIPSVVLELKATGSRTGHARSPRAVHLPHPLGGCRPSVTLGGRSGRTGGTRASPATSKRPQHRAATGSDHSLFPAVGGVYTCAPWPAAW